MALTSKQIQLIKEYLFEFADDVVDSRRSAQVSRTINDLYDFIQLTKVQQVGVIKAWALLKYQTIKATTHTQIVTTLPAQETETDAIIVEINNL